MSVSATLAGVSSAEMSGFPDEAPPRSRLAGRAGGLVPDAFADWPRHQPRADVEAIARALELDVIPRLLAQHGAHGTRPARPALDPSISAEDVSSLCEIALEADFARAASLVGRLRSRGVVLERVYLDLLAPAARRLGELWSADRCSFASVTAGLCCLQQLVFENSEVPQPVWSSQRSDRRILLSPVPGEQHSFGLLIVSEFFRHWGWDVCSGVGGSARELVGMVKRERFSMVGLSLACESRLGTMGELIRDLRRASVNPRLGVLVGGPAFAEQPGLAALVGADVTASDGQQAVLKAETLFALLSQQR